MNTCGLVWQQANLFMETHIANSFFNEVLK
jgi:hypothetical protein